jgi:two-component sensor histidine kinase
MTHLCHFASNFAVTHTLCACRKPDTVWEVGHDGFDSTIWSGSDNGTGVRKLDEPWHAGDRAIIRVFRPFPFRSWERTRCCKGSVAECLRRATEAEDRAARCADPTLKADYQRMAQSWQTLARSYQFQNSLGHFILFNRARRNIAQPTDVGHNRFSVPDGGPVKSKSYFIDRLAELIASIRPWSAEALAIAATCIVISTLVRVLVGWTPTDLLFAVYLPAIVGAGLLAGVPAAVGVTAASLLMMLWAFVPPYFQFKWPNHTSGATLLIYLLSSLLTICFAHYCRAVLHRLNQRDLANQVTVKELNHRRRNLFSMIQLIVRRSLADNPERIDDILSHIGSVLRANEFLADKTDRPTTIKSLLLQELDAYGEDRLDARGPELSLQPETARHLLLIFHELATNAAKYGSLSLPNGRVSVEWRWNGSRRLALTWKESGGPIVTPPNKDGFGSQLIDLCIKALSGSIQPNYSPVGYSYSMALRLKK